MCASTLIGTHWHTVKSSSSHGWSTSLDPDPALEMDALFTSFSLEALQ